MERILENSYLFPKRVGDIACKEKSLTQQHFAEDVDVNNIVARAVKTGLLADPAAISDRQAVFGDFSEIGSYDNALNRVLAAQRAFDALPANVRSRFDNDPGKLIEFMADVKNKDEAIKLGLINDVAAISAAKVADVPAATPTPAPQG